VIAAVLALAAFLSGCGYKVGGKADLLPASVRTIAIPAFSNTTTRYKLTEQIPSAITREFISRSRYRIVPDPREADAVLEGAVANVMSAPTIFDQATGRAAGIQVSVFLNLRLVERSTGAVLYTRQGLEVRQRYEVSIEELEFFDESTTAMQRLSQEVARQVVSAVLSAF
jgi:curli biogenesis system outer membrane secretion channel CsgG